MKSCLLLAVVLATSAPFASAGDQTAADRERTVRVALALADTPAPTKLASPVPAPVVSAVKIDWFADSPVLAAKVPCICGDDCKCAAGTCPGACPVAPAKAVAAAPKYRVEKQCQQWYDDRGRLHQQCIDVMVLVK